MSYTTPRGMTLRLDGTWQISDPKTGMKELHIRRLRVKIGGGPLLTLPGRDRTLLPRRGSTRSVIPIVP